MKTVISGVYCPGALKPNSKTKIPGASGSMNVIVKQQFVGVSSANDFVTSVVGYMYETLDGRYLVQAAKIAGAPELASDKFERLLKLPDPKGREPFRDFVKNLDAHPWAPEVTRYYSTWHVYFGDCE